MALMRVSKGVRRVARSSMGLEREAITRGMPRAARARTAGLEAEEGWTRAETFYEGCEVSYCNGRGVNGLAYKVTVF